MRAASERTTGNVTAARLFYCVYASPLKVGNKFELSLRCARACVLCELNVCARVCVCMLYGHSSSHAAAQLIFHKIKPSKICQQQCWGNLFDSWHFAGLFRKRQPQPQQQQQQQQQRNKQQCAAVHTTWQKRETSKTHTVFKANSVRQQPESEGEESAACAYE